MKIHDLEEYPQLIIQAADKAMKDGTVVNLAYKGERRLVEVHTIGISKAMNPVMRVFDVDKKGWRLLDINKVSDMYAVTQKSEAPRTLEGYVKGDKGMVDIFVEA